MYIKFQKGTHVLYILHVNEMMQCHAPLTFPYQYWMHFDFPRNLMLVRDDAITYAPMGTGMQHPLCIYNKWTPIFSYQIMVTWYRPGQAVVLVYVNTKFTLTMRTISIPYCLCQILIVAHNSWTLHLLVF